MDIIWDELCGRVIRKSAYAPRRLNSISPPTPLFVRQLVHANNNKKIRISPFWEESIGDRWILLSSVFRITTREKALHYWPFVSGILQRASNPEDVSVYSVIMSKSDNMAVKPEPPFPMAFIYNVPFLQSRWRCRNDLLSGTWRGQYTCTITERICLGNPVHAGPPFTYMV